MILQVLLGNVVPAVIAAAVLFVGWRAWSRTREPIAGGTWSGAVGVGLGMVFAQFAIAGWLGAGIGDTGQWIWPRDTTARLAHIVIVAMIVGLVESRWRWPVPLRAALRLLVCAGAAWVVLGDYVVRTRGVGEAVAWIAVPSLYGLLLWASLDRVAARRPGASVPLAVWASAAGLSVVALNSAFASGAQSFGAVSAIGAAAAVVAWLKPRLTIARGGAGVLAVSLLALICSVEFATEPLYIALAVGAAGPLTVWLRELKPVRELRPWQAALAVTLAACAVAGAAAAVSFAERAPIVEDEWGAETTQSAEFRAQIPTRRHTHPV